MKFGGGRTWNYNGFDVIQKDDDLEDLLDLQNQRVDIYAIGFQEFHGDIVDAENAIVAVLGSEDYEVIEHVELTGQKIFETPLKHSAIKMVVVIRKQLADFVSHVESAELATKLGGLLNTKGAVGLGFLLGNTSFVFVNTHLTAHQHKVNSIKALGYIVTLCRLLLLFIAAIPLDSTSRTDVRAPRFQRQCSGIDHAGLNPGQREERTIQ